MFSIIIFYYKRNYVVDNKDRINFSMRILQYCYISSRNLKFKSYNIGILSSMRLKDAGSLLQL